MRRLVNRPARLLSASAVVAVVAVLATSLLGAATSQTFVSTADSYTSKKNPKTTYGSVTSMKVQGGSGIKNAYLKFAVSGLGGPVTRATLRLWTLASSSVGLDVRFVADNSWTESAITYSNAPAPSPTVTASSGAFGLKVWVSLDVTPLITGNGTYSFALTTASSDQISIASKEKGAATAPQLVVETQPAPSAPLNTSPPTITGTAQEGQTVTASPGTWTGTAPIAYAYQWRRCDSAGNNCADIPAATASDYTLTAGDVGSTVRVQVTASNSAGSASASSAQTATVTAAASTDPVIAAAGDICSSATNCAPTAGLLGQIKPDRVLTLGDNAYPDGSASDYASYYDPNWGTYKAKTSPAPGNHDYHTAGGAGYFGYFGSQAPAPYYSFDLGSWHLISLNGEISVSSGSAQEQWLKADLAAHQGQCVLAYWHEPRFSSGSTHGSRASLDAFWRDLYAAGADLVLNGHEHNYERFAPQNPNAQADPNGIREFVVGTGGTLGNYPFGTPLVTSEVRQGNVKGVLKVTLHTASYEWQFVPAAGYTFTDSGVGSCSGVTPPAQIPWRFAYSNYTDPNLATQYGYNLIEVFSKAEADATPAGTQGQVWLGDYTNAPTCDWQQSDATISAMVSSMANDPKV